MALPGDRTHEGRSVWFGGAKLAADLSWPKLASRWRDGEGATPREGARGVTPIPRRLTGLDRAKAWRDAAAMAAAATEDVARLAGTEPDAASDVAHATGRLLTSTARVSEGRRGGPLTRAADTYDRAARDLHGRQPRRRPVGDAVRSTARLVAMLGRASRDETTQVMALVANLAALADAVAGLRYAQHRRGQADAAHVSAHRLRDVAIRATTVANANRRTTGVIHSPPIAPVVHRSAANPSHPGANRRRVTP